MVFGREFYPDCQLERYVPSYKPKLHNQDIWTTLSAVRSNYLDVWVVTHPVHTDEAYYLLSSESIDLGQNLQSVDILHPIYLGDHYDNQIVDESLEYEVVEQSVILYL